MSERKPHKWSEIIKAWADGKPIQFKIGENDWEDYDPTTVQNSQSSAIFFPFVVPRFGFLWIFRLEMVKSWIGVSDEKK